MPPDHRNVDEGEVKLGVEFRRVPATLDARKQTFLPAPPEDLDAMLAPADLMVLNATALSFGFIHTLSGPDHYVPFVAMSKVGRWSLKKTVIITLLCGLAHVGSSVLLGFVGIAFGILLRHLELIEGVRGDVAAWLLIGFGLAYFTWGLWRAIRHLPHKHLYPGADGSLSGAESHGSHGNGDDGASGAPAVPKPAAMTPWVLMVIFLFGPCEPLIPLLMYPAAEANVWGVVSVTLLFSAATLATMTTMVVLMYWGASAIHWHWMHRYSHALAGLVVLTCGVAIKFGL